MTYDCELPGKPSELLGVAMKDLALVEEDPRFAVEMGWWHMPIDHRPNPVCYVCLAGAVMAKTCDVPPDREARPSMFLHGEKFAALDYFRVGQVEEALEMLGITDRRGVSDRIVTHYEDDPEDFRRDMQVLISELRRAGL